MFQVVELPPAERAAFVERECGADAALARLVLELLASHEQASGFLDRDTAIGAPSLPAGPAHEIAQATPERLGRYVVGPRIGEGGFADVYQAEQTEPVQRRVAIKVLKPGMTAATSSRASTPSDRRWRWSITPASPGSSTPGSRRPAGRSS